jgi:hypothetical protein
MNRLRRLGYVTYSRLHTDICLSALTEWMKQNGTRVYMEAGEPTLRAAG